MPDFYIYDDPDADTREYHRQQRIERFGLHLPTRKATRYELDELVEQQGGFWWGPSRWVSAEEYATWT